MSSGYAPYVCPLDEDTQRKAQEELYEDPKNRQGAIDTFRTWIKQQKHMKCPMDDVFLLGFLRAKHFSQLEAREALERFMAHREKLPTWMKNLDTKDKDMVEMMKNGPLLFLPKLDKDNRRIVIMRPGRLHVEIAKGRMLTYCRLFVAFGYFHYLTDEMTQVHGTVTVADWTGHTLAKEMKVPLETKKNLAGMLQKSFPARLKVLHMYNAGGLIEVLMGIISAYVSDKLKKRMRMHNNGLESLYEHIPMELLPEDYLPDDFSGPTVGTMEQCLEYVISELTKPVIRDRIKYLSSDEFYIKTKEKDTDVQTASFRKLIID